ncbi:MAG TPA: hypothetical protein VFU62_04500 [Hanamia sp.]|nr:hypothetical protein [Hanamia sp.]
MKKILGLDLGTTSIGWAFVKESDVPGESKIEKIGVRVNPLTTEEFRKGQTNFVKCRQNFKTWRKTKLRSIPIKARKF